MLIGPPASGKSTWRARDTTNAIVISGDDMIEEECRRTGLTYAEVFPTVCFKTQKRALHEHFQDAIFNHRNIIIDRTNLTIKSRRSFLASLPRSYERIAIVFTVTPSVLFERLERRGQETGKIIPREVVEDMMARLQPPTRDEFDTIVELKD
jgi:predicted kinase